METALRLAATIQPGGRIEILDAQLPVGEAVDVIVLLRQPVVSSGRSIVDVLAEAPGHLAFSDASAVDAFVREERDAWDR